MAERGYIEIHVNGLFNNQQLSPESTDITQTKEIIADMEKFLGTDRPNLVSYIPEAGSIKHKFLVPLSTVLFFTAITGAIIERKSIDFLESDRAKVIAKWQNAAKAEHLKITLGSSLANKPPLVIDENTSYLLPNAEWVDTEIYLYGKVDMLGGVQKANIEVDTEEYGRVKVQATQDMLAADENRLYKILGVRATGKQNLIDRELKDLKFVEYIQYDPAYRKEELDILIERGTKTWAAVRDVDVWVRNIRGAYAVG